MPGQRNESHSNDLKRSAFTLVEVMVAAILISIVGLSLLKMHNNSAQMSSTMQQKFAFSDWVLMSAFEVKLEKVRVRTGFDNLTKAFNIDNREIREKLRKKAEINAELVERIDPADIIKAIEQENNTSAPMLDALRLEVYRQDLKMEHETYPVYRIVRP